MKDVNKKQGADKKQMNTKDIVLLCWWCIVIKVQEKKLTFDGKTHHKMGQITKTTTKLYLSGVGYMD